MKDMAEELTATHEDVRYVRHTVTMLMKSDTAHEAAIESLRKRMERVERKVGITRWTEVYGKTHHHHWSTCRHDQHAHGQQGGYQRGQEDVTALRSEMKAGFERIENLLLAEQKREIEDLKKRMKRLEDALAV
jgi:hypothetical protein